jgi:ABC-2 type transport system permease protein
MKKVWLIGCKDLILAFRDAAALLLMLAAPFALTLGLGLVSGRFAGASSSGLSDIEVIVVNQDGQALGDALVALLQAEELEDLLAPVAYDDPALARARVDADQAAAAVVIPAGFTRSLTGESGEAPVQIDLYVNPSRPTSAGVIVTLVEEFVSRAEVARAGGQVAVAQLLAQGLIAPPDAPRTAREIATRRAADARGSAITLANTTAGDAVVQFDVLAYMAPGMALMFLMFTATNGGRTLLAERNMGALPRLLVSPTTSYQVLGGKMLGIYLTGVAQMVILVGASTLLFRLNWGDALGVLALVLAAVMAAVGWGMLITALAKTPGQVSAVGSALMLTFGMLGGSFLPIDLMPAWFRLLSKITPNAWGLDGFTMLALGGRLGDVLGAVAALLAMGAALFVVSAIILGRRGLIER